MGLKVLIVEDNFIIQMFLESIMEDMGHSIIGLADNSSAAMKIMEEEVPDLIFLDIGLSGELDGIRTAKLIKAAHEVPIVFITGNSDAATLEKARKTNPIHILYKPIDEYKLAAEFEVIINKINRINSGSKIP